MRTNENSGDAAGCFIANPAINAALQPSDVTMTRRAITEGDRVRFWQLAESHDHKLYNYIQKSLAFSTEADDVYQETLLRALRYFPSYRPAKSFSGWLFAIAHNEIRKNYRSARRAAAHSANHFQTVIGFSGLISLAGQVDRALVEEVYRAADGLKPKSREVFFLFYDGGFTVPEISEITGLRQGNVKFILSKVRESVRKTLGASHE